MILLDTNVVSAIVDPVRSPAVDAWLDRQPIDALWTTAITVYESRRGLALLPIGRRREALAHAIHRFFEVYLIGRVAQLDRRAAEIAGDLFAAREARGARVDHHGDTLIAGIAIANRATLATRNLRHFADLPTPVVDPWTA